MFYRNFSHALNLYLQPDSRQLKVTSDLGFDGNELRFQGIENVFVGFWWLVTRHFDYTNKIL